MNNKKSEKLKAISIIIPVYNEEKTLEMILKKVLSADSLGLKKEIIVVDDGSDDRTRSILKKFKNKELKIIYHKKNQGKGMAIRIGIKNATGDIVLIQDADSEYSIDDYPKIIQPLVSDKSDIVYGSRFKGAISGMRWPNYIANKILTITANLLYGLKITDEATAYKAFKKEVFSQINLKCKGFEFCPEITAKAAKKHFRFLEVPIIYHGRSNKEGKKIKLKDGFQAFWTLIYYRFKD